MRRPVGPALGLLLLLLAATPGLAAHGGPAAPLPLVSAPDLEARLDAGRRPFLVDLRSAEEYRRGHLPGARSIPLRELRRRAYEIPRGRVVLYCACPREELEAAYRLLSGLGLEQIEALEGGVAAWTERDYPLER